MLEGQHLLELWGVCVLDSPALIIKPLVPSEGFPDGSLSKESACQCRGHRRPRFDPWVRKMPWRREWQPTPVFLPGEAHVQRSLVGYSPKGHKESDTTE